jgi:hypothetical protein
MPIGKLRAEIEPPRRPAHGTVAGLLDFFTVDLCHARINSFQPDLIQRTQKDFDANDP